jgi:hypothetical protein
MDFPQMGNGPNRKPIVDALRNTAQSASNMVAENISVPMDAIAWALRKAGVPVEKPMFGSDWMKEKGVTPQVEQGASKVIGDTIGMISPMGFTKQGAQALIQGAGKLKNLPVGMSIKDVSEYGISHRPMTVEQGAAPLHDLSAAFDDTIYSPAGLQNYGTGSPLMDRQALNAFKAVRGNPNAEITAYRAIPLDADQSVFNAGDWVSVSKDYAKSHGEGALGGKYRIIEQKVPASFLTTNADSILEQGYYPSVK